MGGERIYCLGEGRDLRKVNWGKEVSRFNVEKEVIRARLRGSEHIPEMETGGRFRGPSVISSEADSEDHLQCSTVKAPWLSPF